MPRRTLVVMRHAEAQQVGPSDFERDLTPRGRRAAGEVGAWLAARGVEPDHALVSAALRTRQTFSAACGSGGWQLEPELDRGLYAADPDAALDLVRLVDDSVRALLLIGHNPTVASLAQLLDDGEGDEAAMNEMAAGTFPPSATAVFEVGSTWADLGPGGARLTGYTVGDG